MSGHARTSSFRRRGSDDGREGWSASGRPPFRVRMIRLVLSGVMLLGPLACVSVATGSGPNADMSVEDGATAGDAPAVASFTAEQADRGAQVFSRVCSACHGVNEFRGPIFSMTWMAEPVGHLFEHISSNMPEDRPGSLSPEEYAAVVAHFLRENGRQPGERELPADAELLRTIRW